jgi:transcriptional regulator with XRE-family HTH domain
LSTGNFDQSSIKYYRYSWHLTQEQFAEQFGFDPRTVRRWESGTAKPRTKNRQKLATCLRAREDSMDRRNFFRKAAALSLTFAAPYQEQQLDSFTKLLSPATTSLSIDEELSLVETLTKTCWQLLPHQANVVDRRHLDYVREYRQKLASWLNNSPGSSIDSQLASALSEVVQIEGTLLFALKRPSEAEKCYRTAIQVAHEAGNFLLEAIGLTWFSNFLIDTNQAGRASAPVEAAKRKAEKGGATPLVHAWIVAAEADAWANQSKIHGATYKCERALDKTSELTHMGGIEQERYPVPYDHPWLFGYRGTVYAHLGRSQDARRAQSELKQGLASLGPTNTLRQWSFYKDLVITHSLDKNVDEACHCARIAMNIAEQTKAPMYLQRIQDTAQQFLKPWETSSIVKNLMEECQVVQQKLALT